MHDKYQLQDSNIYVKQNFWLKLTILILGSVTAVVIPMKAISYLIAVTIAYFMLTPIIFKFMLAGIKAILPFIAAYSLFATFLNIPLPEMLSFIVRIFTLLFLLTYFITSLSMMRFLEDLQSFKKKNIPNIIVFYSIATLLYFRRLSTFHKLSRPTSKISSNKKNLISNLINAIHTNWLEKEKIQAETETLIASEYISPSFLTSSNLWGCIYITVLILILSM